MGRRPNPDNLARQDQALALLRDRYPFPMNTGDIAREVWMVEKGHWEPSCGYEDRGDGVLVRTRKWTKGCHTHCPKIWIRYPNQPSADTRVCRNALLRLERDGLVERVDRSDLGDRRSWWRATEWLTGPGKDPA